MLWFFWNVCPICRYEMFEEKGAGEKTVEAVLEGIKKLSSQVRHLVIVTNENFFRSSQL